MISKKEAVTLGMLAIGGVGAAMIVGGGGNGGDTGAKMGALQGVKGRAGGILGSQQDYTSPGVVYNIPKSAAVTFPKITPAFDLSTFLEPKTPPTIPISRGAAGVSAAPKKLPSAQPYIYTGGEIKTGAVSVAPWAMGRTTPAEMGVTTALTRARGGGGAGKAPSPTKKRRVSVTGKYSGR